MSNKESYFCFVIRLELDKPSYADHMLVDTFRGKLALLESKGFKEYKKCAEACNNILKNLAVSLQNTTLVPHNIAWEVNPKSKADGDFMTPAEKWEEGELVKMYIALNQGAPITLENINFVANASIYSGIRDNSLSH